MTYKITDYNGEEIQGSFYEQDLPKTSQDTFRIEKVLKIKGDKCLVKLMGYPKSKFVEFQMRKLARSCKIFRRHADFCGFISTFSEKDCLQVWTNVNHMIILCVKLPYRSV